MGSKQKRIKAAKKAIDIIEILRCRDTTTPEELADVLDISQTSAYYYLRTLKESGYVFNDDEGYRLSLRLFSLGTDVRSKRLVYHTAAEQVSRLADETGELALFMTEEGGKGIYLDLNRGERAAIQADWLGKRCHLHDNALGKAILSLLSEDTVKEIINSHGLPAKTENTITDRDVLFDELSEIRETGVAFDRGEQLKGLQCVAAPVIGSNQGSQSVLGAICVASAKSRVDEKRRTEEFPRLVQDAANIIQLNYASE
jgi:DNA-binding IclR family transcriptional regulator